MNFSPRSFVLFSTLTVLAAAGVVSGAVKFTSTWASPDARSVSFKGKTVAALAMTDDLSLRMSTEEALARELTAKGMRGVASYRMIPAEELKDVDKAKGWFQREQVAGVVALRPVSREQVPRYSPDVWVSSSYSSLWGYYPYGWTTMYVSGAQVGTDTVIVVESLIFDVSTGKLVWGGVSQATNPKSLQVLVTDLVNEAAKKIEKQFRD
jgi:hypothetical protein